MKIVRNLSRLEARAIKAISFQTAWISFSDPDNPDSIVNNPNLEKLNNLKLSIWNLWEPHFFNETWRFPPSEDEIHSIVDFLIENKNYNIIINCYGGKGRSGAVAKFCHDKMNYFWSDSCQSIAKPNSLIYKTMVNYFNQKYDKHN